MLIKDVLDQVKEEDTPLEKARTLYIELAKRISFNTTIRNTTRIRYGMMYDTKINPELFDDTDVICTVWVQLYSFLLDCVGIKNRIINHVHKYIELYIDDVRWIADATKGSYTDISRIKNGDYTHYFGIAECQGEEHTNDILYDESLKILKPIDQKNISYITSIENNKKLEENIKKFKEGSLNIKQIIGNNSITPEKETLFKIEYLFSKLGRLNDGYYEAKDYVYHLETILLTDEELKRVGSVELKRTNKDLTVDLVQCIYVYHDHRFEHFLLKPNLPIKKVSDKDLIKLAVYGYGVDEKRIPGIDFPNHFYRGIKSQSNFFKMFLYKKASIYQYSLSQKR